MHLNHSNKSKIFSAVKKFRGDYTSTMPSSLETPVGSYYGQDILEGFAADTEHLGKCNEGNNNFDQEFSKVNLGFNSTYLI